MEVENIVFYDGVCGVCNSGIDYLLKKDKRKLLFFAPLQGNFAHKTLPVEFTQDLDTFVFYHKGKIYTKSTAFLKLTQVLGGYWSSFVIFKIIPTILRDGIYDFVAKNRLKWFGKKDSCRISTPEERTRFLD